MSRTKVDNHDMYYQDQKQGIVEVFVTLRLPVNMYEAAAGLYRVANYRSFDDYVYDCVINDLELLSQGEVADDMVIKKVSHKNSPWAQNQKQHWSGVLKRLKEQDKIKEKNHCKKCGEWKEFDSSVCSECGEISK